MLEENKTEERVSRHHITQEDFTPPLIVDDMLTSLGQDIFTNFNKSVLDNSCGIGNFLVKILEKRLCNTSNINEAISALKTIYGVEFMADNVEECRKRLYDTFVRYYPNVVESFNDNFKVRAIIRNRIQWSDALVFDYNKWPELHTIPNDKHMNISFKVIKHEEDTKYPMWYKELKKRPLF